MEQSKVLELLHSLTMREKILQMYQLPSMFLTDEEVEITGPLASIGFDKIDDEVVYNAGSLITSLGAQKSKEVQDLYLAKNKHGIPLLYMSDVIHGFRTIFPVSLALGCSFDTDMVRRVAEISALEASVTGLHVTFSPMVDLVRDPRWGRVNESTGEDTYLNALMAAAFVEGYQGDTAASFGKLAACVKHFAAYGAAEGGRDYNTVDVSEIMLRAYHFPAYKAAIDAGCALVMASFNTVKGVPATGNKWLLREVLRKEWAFDGVVISDWGGVNELMFHSIAKDGKEAARRSVLAGLDIEMMTTEYISYLEELVTEGSVPEALIDEACLRVLELKNKLGLFENPYKDADEAKAKEYVLCKAHRDFARQSATQSMVLLKNEDVLPLQNTEGICALIGPYARTQEILGPWGAEGRTEEAISIAEGVRSKVALDKILIADGCTFAQEDESGFAEAVTMATKADYVILALGEEPSMSGEACSRTSISLPATQERLAEAVLQLGKPTVVVLFNGRPLDIRGISAKADAILEVWFPGTEGGNAIADVLYGDAEPRGRLSMSIPQNVGQVPVYYNYFNTGRPVPRDGDTNYYSHYLDAPNTALYPFGFGLTYTSFAYSQLLMSKNLMTKTEPITVSVTVKNTGERVGTELVQLYIRDVSGSVVRPVKELKGFAWITLKQGEEQVVSFVVEEEMLRFYNEDFTFASESGDFIAMVGGDSATYLQAAFVLA